MSERDTRRHAIQALKAAGMDPHAVENRCEAGMPDIECTAGWIECKYRPSWPAKTDTPVTLPHPLSPGQRIWINRRHAAGGRVYVLLQIAGDWLLFYGVVACRVLGSVRAAELRAAAVGRWSTVSEMSAGLPACLKRFNS